MAGEKNTRRKRKSWFRRRMELALALTVLAVLAFAANWVYQVWRKPSELVGVFDEHFHKNPDETWQAYGDTFIEKSTSIMTPDFLAALAQAESNGNPIARTYWKFRLTTDPTRIFAPASSAAGMLQITEGTFKEASDFCIHEGKAFSKDENEVCRERIYSRLIPSHAIEMTSARLHWHVERLVRRFGAKRAGVAEKQSLATIIHLCGLGKGESLVRRRFRLTQIGRCGDHDPAAYVRRVRRLKAQFTRLLESRASVGGS